MNRKGHLGIGILSLGITQHFLAPLSLSIENVIMAIACVVAGVKTPDLDLYFKYFYPKIHRNKRYLYHRQFTHSILLTISLLVFSVYTSLTYANYLFYFSIGLVSHLIADMLTGTIPIFITGSYYGFFRIGISHQKTKQFFVNFGENTWIPMILLGGILFFIPPYTLQPQIWVIHLFDKIMK